MTIPTVIRPSNDQIDRDLAVQSSREHLPHGEMKFVFIISHAAIPDLKHIQIIPATRPTSVNKRGSFAENIHHRAMEPCQSATNG